MKLFKVAFLAFAAFYLLLNADGRLFGQSTISTDPADGDRVKTADREFGIKEIVADEFQQRYQKWKSELLSTEFGRQQWDRYANNDKFLLKIVVSTDKKFGARTGDFKWDDNGRLIGATITLGKNLDRGFPDPVYYPVMNSLSMLSEPV